MMGWIEERRFHFIAPALHAVRMITAGATVVLITDKERAWFSTYVMQNINTINSQRPMISVVTIEGIFPAFDAIDDSQSLDMLEDMLDIAYNNNYIFWYVGKGEDKRADIAKRSDKNLLWVLDQEVPNSFVLPSYDSFLDVKLLHLYRLFNRTIDGALFGEFEL